MVNTSNIHYKYVADTTFFLKNWILEQTELSKNAHRNQDGPLVCEELDLVICPFQKREKCYKICKG